MLDGESFGLFTPDYNFERTSSNDIPISVKQRRIIAAISVRFSSQ
jgi:hypothetical protein